MNGFIAAQAAQWAKEKALEAVPLLEAEVRRLRAKAKAQEATLGGGCHG